jgi:hypothetical protein
MAKSRRGNWLKKYTKLEFLEKTLEKRCLHLGDPATWPDKNDGELIKIYSETSGFQKTRSACLTMAPDRYHFWALFGEQHKGVCLWFDRRKLVADIVNDKSLISGRIRYLRPQQLSCIKLNELPFAKRVQYHDEQEFRILRDFRATERDSDGFHFSSSSLVRIYLNPWLKGEDQKRIRAQTEEIVQKFCPHVSVHQSKMLEYDRWINGAKKVALASQARK